MVIDMNEAQLQTLAQIRELMAGTADVSFRPLTGRQERYEFGSRTRLRLGWASHRRPDKALWTVPAAPAPVRATPAGSLDGNIATHSPFTQAGKKPSMTTCVSPSYRRCSSSPRRMAMTSEAIGSSEDGLAESTAPDITLNRAPLRAATRFTSPGRTIRSETGMSFVSGKASIKSLRGPALRVVAAVVVLVTASSH
jgi:hypothetical protein